MKRIIITFLLASGAILLAKSPNELESGAPTGQPAFEKSKIEARLNVSVGDDIGAVRFVRENNDPEFYTKVYMLENVTDGFEIRPFLMTAINSTRGAENSTLPKNNNVEVIRYADGKVAVAITAEDYRFLNTGNGQSIDEIVEKLDKQNLTQSSGLKRIMYYPKYWSSTELKAMIEQYALAVGKSIESYEAVNKIGDDSEANGLLIYLTQSEIATLGEMLEKLDRPIPEVEVTYSVYQVDVENDLKMGADFQQWRNGDGSRLFSFANRTRYGWKPNGSGPVIGSVGRGNGNATMIGFNPRWNSRYFDFLRSRGAAKSVMTGTIVVRNNKLASVTSSTQTPYFQDGEKIQNETLTAFFASGTDSLLTVYSLSGEKIVIGDKSTSSVTYAINKGIYNGVTVYQVTANGKNPVAGQPNISIFEVIASKIELGATKGEPAKWAVTDNMTIYHDYMTQTGLLSDAFKIDFSNAQISEFATVLDVAQTSTTAVGYDDTGKTPRLNNTTQKTRLQINNNSGEFIIGGIEKVTREKGNAGMPWLNQIPVLGWIFGSESGANRRYQMVTTISVKINQPDTNVNNDIKNNIRIIDDVVLIPGSIVTPGFNQFGFDKDAKLPEAP